MLKKLRQHELESDRWGERCVRGDKKAKIEGPHRDFCFQKN